MKVKKLLNITVSSGEHGLWFDSDVQGDGQAGWGVTLKIWAGWIIRPYTRPKYWFKKNVPNKWFQHDTKYHSWFKFWFPVLPFVSIAIGKFGCYLGFKTFELHHKEYLTWLPSVEVHSGSFACTPSITFRRTRWK